MNVPGRWTALAPTMLLDQGGSIQRSRYPARGRPFEGVSESDTPVPTVDVKRLTQPSNVVRRQTKPMTQPPIGLTQPSNQTVDSVGCVKPMRNQTNATSRKPNQCVATQTNGCAQRKPLDAQRQTNVKPNAPTNGCVASHWFDAPVKPIGLTVGALAQTNRQTKRAAIERAHPCNARRAIADPGGEGATRRTMGGRGGPETHSASNQHPHTRERSTFSFVTNKRVWA